MFPFWIEWRRHGLWMAEEKAETCGSKMGVRRNTIAEQDWWCSEEPVESLRELGHINCFRRAMNATVSERNTDTHKGKYEMRGKRRGDTIKEF